MLNSVEIWENEIYRSRRKHQKTETYNYKMSGSSLEGLKLQFILSDALEGRVMETDTYWHFYALACSVKNVSGVENNV